ncbi:MAG: cyclase family protein, partial [Roseiflexaceae bacterium]|nr:cyclase family protein [Roseiflexaceae bacterium]
MSNVLSQLVSELNTGTLKIVDLTQPLGPQTPVIGLPPIFASSPGVTIEQISRYDAPGPGWYWNTLHLGEHTGTHFDAPVHWITGKELPENRCDTIPVRRFVGPACVINVTAEVAQRVQRGQTNNFEARSGRSYFQIVRDNVFNLFNIILFSLL